MVEGERVKLEALRMTWARTRLGRRPRQRVFANMQWWRGGGGAAVEAVAGAQAEDGRHVEQPEPGAVSKVQPRCSAPEFDALVPAP